MNFIICGENCRWQTDGMCTLEDISLLTGSCRCCYYEQR